MADIRINALATTAAASASDDFMAIDGTTNGTRKMSAYTPTFSTVTTSGAGTIGGNLGVTGTTTLTGNLTANGTGTQAFAGAITLSSANASMFTRTGLNGVGAASVFSLATDAKTIADGIQIALLGQDSGSAVQTYGILRATITDPTAGSEDSTLDLVSVRAGASVAGLVIGHDTTYALFNAGTTAIAPLRIPHGSAPTSPVNGDMWTTTAGLFVRINGATVGPLT